MVGGIKIAQPRPMNETQVRLGHPELGVDCSLSSADSLKVTRWQATQLGDNERFPLSLCQALPNKLQVSIVLACVEQIATNFDCCADRFFGTLFQNCATVQSTLCVPSSWRSTYA